LLWAFPARAQQDDPLQQQLQQLKQQYADTTRELEQSIPALERQIAEQKEARAKTKEGTVSVAELAARDTENTVFGKSNQVGAKFQGQLPSGPTYDLLREADRKIEKLQEQMNAFEFHVYFRSGYDD
jgi:maltoporin